jgi:hypothetical protein
MMADMTDEEYDALDELWTKNTPKVNFARPGIFARTYGMPVILDPETTRTLAAYAEAVHRTPAQIIGELVRKELQPV